MKKQKQADYSITDLENAVQTGCAAIELFGAHLLELTEQFGEKNVRGNVACGIMTLRVSAIAALSAALEGACQERWALRQENEAFRARLALAPTPPTVAA